MTNETSRIFVLDALLNFSCANVRQRAKERWGDPNSETFRLSDLSGPLVVEPHATVRHPVSLRSSHCAIEEFIGAEIVDIR